MVFSNSTVSCVVPPVVIRNDEWTWEEAYHYLYEDAAFDNIVISPGPGSPMCPSDIGTTQVPLIIDPSTYL